MRIHLQQGEVVEEAIATPIRLLSHTYVKGERNALPPASELGKRHSRMYTNESGRQLTIHVCVLGWDGKGDVQTESKGVAIGAESVARGRRHLSILSVGGVRGKGRVLNGREAGKVSGYSNPYATIALYRLIDKAIRRGATTISVDPDAPCSRLYERLYDTGKFSGERKRRYWNGIELIYRTVGFTLTAMKPDGYTPRLLSVADLPSRSELFKRLRQGLTKEGEAALAPVVISLI